MEIVFINFLIQKDFLNSCSRQSFFLLTNQNAHLITKNQSNFALQKSKFKFKVVDIVSEQARTE